MSTEDLIIDLPSDDITIGSGKDKTVPDVVVADPIEKVDEGAVAPEDAIDAIKRDLDAALRQSEARAREVAEAKRDAEKERAARTNLETELGRSQGQGLRTEWQKAQSEHQQIVNGLHATKIEMDSAKAALRAAIDAGDSNGVATAQERLSLAAVDLRTYEQGKVGAEAEIQRVENYIRSKTTAKPDVVEPKPTPQAQTPEDWINGVRSQIGDKPAEWLAKNKQFVTDPALNKKMLKFAEYYSEVEEKPLNSADFIAALNAKFLPKEEAMADDEVKPVARPAQRAAVASAPVSRGGGEFYSSRNQTASKVRLPKALATFCDQAGLNKTTYAMGIIEDIKAGKLPKNYLDDDYDHQFA